MHLVYIADPLCSWCYGFGPELSRLLARHPEATLELVMGGLRPGTTEPMSAAFRDMLRGHWEHVREASGLPFSQAILERSDFVYDTEPACRAVVAARTTDASRALAFMKAIQDAFYRDGLDVTRTQVLADLAAATGFDRAAFVEAFEGNAMRTATREDFARSQALGVSGFPTLGVAYGDRIYLVAAGFTPSDTLAERLEQIEARVSSRPGAASA